MQALKAKGNQRTIQKLIALKKSAQEDSAYRVAIRLHSVILNLEGRTPSDISDVLKVNRTNVPAWIRAWNQYGIEGLLEGHRCGRPSGLNPNDKEKLLDIVESGPVAYGFDTGVWTSIIISKVIQNEFNLEYHPGHVRKLLKQVGLSFQRPTYVLAKADPAVRNKWTRYTYPLLKKKPLKKKP
jgi:transposase